MAHTSGRIRFATAGVEPGQAPVSGGEPGAVEASLSIMVGGEAADFEAAKPVLEAVGKTIVHVGPAGSGQTVNAANQLIVAGNIELLAEAIVFLEAYGVDTEAVAPTSAVARPHPSHAHRDGIRPNHRLRRSSIPRRSVKRCNHFRAREHPAISQSLSATTTPGRDDQPDPPRSPPQRPAHTVGWRCRHHHHADVAALQVADQQSRCCGVWHRAEFGGRPPTPPR